MELEGKVALVTGGGTGLGKAISLKYASEGADVAVSSRNIENLKKVCTEIEAIGRRSLAVAADVRIKSEVDNMVCKVIDKFGRIDILVNNAGALRMVSILDCTEQDWDMIMDTNLKGVFLCTQAVAKQMVKQKYGKIINMSSNSALGGITEGEAIYSSSKFGVNGLTKASALEFGHYGINVNAIAPGRILTPMIYSSRTPEQVADFIRVGETATVLARMGNSDDISNLALFLASEKSSFISAEMIASNGGRTDLMGR